MNSLAQQSTLVCVMILLKISSPSQNVYHIVDWGNRKPQEESPACQCPGSSALPISTLSVWPTPTWLMWPQHNRCNQLGNQQSYRTHRGAAPCNLSHIASRRFRRGLQTLIHLVPSRHIRLLASYCIITLSIMLIVNLKRPTHCYDGNAMKRS